MRATRILILALLIFSSNSFASLEGDTNSIDADHSFFKGVKKTKTDYSNYSVYEIDAKAHTIREYVNKSGKVFGVAWIGRMHPNFKQLLGKHYDSYSIEHAKKHTSKEYKYKRTSSVETDQLVVRTWGQMRRLQGQAYLPKLLPQGVTASAIK